MTTPDRLAAIKSRAEAATPGSRVEHPLATADQWDDDSPFDCLKLGQLIDALRRLDPKAVLLNGFCNPHSYRGYYEQLAFEPKDGVTVGEALETARSAVDETCHGYKGGAYRMDEGTPCWIAEHGSTGRPLQGLAILRNGAVEWHGETPETAFSRVSAERETARADIAYLIAEVERLRAFESAILAARAAYEDEREPLMTRRVALAVATAEAVDALDRAREE